MKIKKCELINKIMQHEFTFDNGDVVVYTYNNYTKIPEESYILNNRKILIENKSEDKQYIETIKIYVNTFELI